MLQAVYQLGGALGMTAAEIAELAQEAEAVPAAGLIRTAEGWAPLTRRPAAEIPEGGQTR